MSSSKLDGNTTVAIVDGTHICLVPSPSSPQPSPSSPTTDTIPLPHDPTSITNVSRTNHTIDETSIPAVPLRSIVSDFLLTRIDLSSLPTTDPNRTVVVDTEEEHDQDEDETPNVGIIGVLPFGPVSNPSSSNDPHHRRRRRHVVYTTNSTRWNLVPRDRNPKDDRNAAHVDHHGMIHIQPSSSPPFTNHSEKNETATTYNLIRTNHNDHNHRTTTSMVVARVVVVRPNQNQNDTRRVGSGVDGGYLIADFCGIEAREQILFVPSIVTRVDSPNHTDGDGLGTTGHERNQNQPHPQRIVLRDVLSASVLTDGTAVAFRKGRHVDVGIDPKDGVPRIVLRSITATTAVTKETLVENVGNGIGNDTCKTETKEKHATADVESMNTETNTEGHGGTKKRKRNQPYSTPISSSFTASSLTMKPSQNTTTPTTMAVSSATNTKTDPKQSLSRFASPSLSQSLSFEKVREANPTTTATVAAAAAAATIITTNNHTTLPKPPSSSTTTTAAWKTTLRKGLQNKVRHELSTRRERAQLEQVQEMMIRQSRMALQTFVLNGGVVGTSSGSSDDSTGNRGDGDVTKRNRTVSERNKRVLLDETKSTGGQGSSGVGGVIPEIVGMRCRTSPTDVGENGAFLSVRLHLEVDVVVVPHGSIPSRAATTNDGGSGIRVGLDVESGAVGKTPSDSDDSGGGFDESLNDLQLSCSPSEPSSSSLPWLSSSNVEVRTCSAVVPTLRTEECVTIMARVDVGGISPPPYRYPLSRDQNVSTNNNDDNNEDEVGEHDKTVVSLNVTALWRKRSNNPTLARDDGGYVGTIIGMVRLPYKAFLLDLTTRNEKDYDDNQDDFMAHCFSNSSKVPLVSSTTKTMTMTATDIPIFDYRKPRLLVVDVFDCNYRWELELEGLVSAVGRGQVGRIDVCCDNDGDAEGGEKWGTFDYGEKRRLRIAVFASSPERRAGLVELVLNALPPTARIIVPSFTDADVGYDDGTTDTKYIARTLLKAIRNELSVLERHSALVDEREAKKMTKTTTTKKQLTLACLIETVESQLVSDDLVARLMDGHKC